MNALLVVIGGALGSLLRYWLVEFFYAYGPRNFPYGILAVNIIGCFFIGFFSVWLLAKFGSVHLMYRSLIMVGILGGFTTFSSFSLDVVNFFQQGMLLKAFGYIAISLLTCLLATYFGMMVARAIA